MVMSERYTPFGNVWRTLGLLRGDGDSTGQKSGGGKEEDVLHGGFVFKKIALESDGLLAGIDIDVCDGGGDALRAESEGLYTRSAHPLMPCRWFKAIA